jgi:DNA repair exonuclease SbcCD nuclease subunit
VTFRFLHTADLHLDSPLRTLALRDAELGSLIANATRAALVRMVDACLERQVDALVIAGDLYDGELRSMATPLFLTRQFQRLNEAGVAVFLVRGNHDALATVTKHLTLPDNVTLFSARGEVKLLEGKGVAVHGISFPTGQVPGSLLPKFRGPVAGVANIGILHTSLAGAEGHDVYAPCAVADLAGHGFAYWALGHIHKRQVHSTTPAVVMPGMPQGRDINEEGAKSATLVTLHDDGRVELEEVLTSIAEFRRLDVDLSGCAAMAEVPGRLRAALGAARDASAADYLVVRPRLTGATALAARLRRDADVLLAEAQAAAAETGRTLIDLVEQRASLPAAAPETKAMAAGDPIAEMRASLQGAPTAELLATATAAVRELRAALPPELRDAFGSDDADMARLAAGLLAEGSEDVLARLAAGEGE